MNAKTYGQVLLDEMENGTEFDRLSLVSDATFERCARTVILEFVRRVEELQEEIADSGDYDDAPNIYHETKPMAFDQLSTELKEAK